VHLDPTDASVRALLDRALTGPIVMLNLLRLRDITDYSTHPELEPLEPISGGAAYQKYIEHTEPYLTSTGGSILLLEAASSYFIGPQEERWDVVMLIQQTSLQDFFSSSAMRATSPAWGTGWQQSKTHACFQSRCPRSLQGVYRAVTATTMTRDQSGRCPTHRQVLNAGHTPPARSGGAPGL
jgi:hypothetical protein